MIDITNYYFEIDDKSIYLEFDIDKCKCSRDYYRQKVFRFAQWLDDVKSFKDCALTYDPRSYPSFEIQLKDLHITKSSSDKVVRNKINKLIIEFEATLESFKSYVSKK